jgi:O-antigen biosynthesis protein WbqP
MKRLFDFFMAILMSISLAIPILFLAILVRFTSSGPILYWSNRIGKVGKIYRMPKFRTMRVDAPELATHLLDKPDKWLTPMGSFLRRSSLDELPQLWSILRGDMSFVGPRPALFNQYDLIEQRKQVGVDSLLPGLTGWAQVNGRDELEMTDKVRLDFEYFERRSFLFDIYILWLTFVRVLSSNDISH